jgi:twitching motility protein PilT
MDIAVLLAFAVRNQASDLHLCAGLPPLLRVHGAIRRVNLQALEATQLQALLHAIMPTRQQGWQAGAEVEVGGLISHGKCQ